MSACLPAFFKENEDVIQSLEGKTIKFFPSRWKNLDITLMEALILFSRNGGSPGTFAGLLISWIKMDIFIIVFHHTK